VIQIVGSGLCTPLGANADQTWNALVEGRYITNHSRALNVPQGDEPRVNRIAEMVAREAIAWARWSQSEVESTALVVGTSKGPAEAWLTAPPATSDNPTPAGRSVVLGLADVSAHLARSLGIVHGPRVTFSAACASALHALVRGALLIRSGEADRVLVVAAESSLHPLFVQSFRRLGVLPPEGVGCRPFDRTRDGFVMSEAAAAVCLEAKDSDHIAPGSVLLDRFAMGGDATHLTASDPHANTLRRLLAHVIDSRPVDLIHAHGTGTEINDPLELSAIESALDEQALVPNLYSHKGALGHSLGAAGLVSVVINWMAHQAQIVPPNVRTESPLLAMRVRIRRDKCSRAIRRSVAIASGFGGALGVVSLTSR